MKAPKNLKKPGSILFLSVPIIAIITYIGSFYQIQPIAWGIIILNVFLLVILARWSQILYILPFKAYLLMVMETESGLPLYQYKWSKQEEVEEWLLSGLISAIMSMGQDILKRGKIKQIDWDLGMLIFTIGDSVTIVLLSTKGSKALRSSLLSFKDMFEVKFRDLLESQTRELGEYEAADALIEKCFAYIPKYL